MEALTHKSFCIGEYKNVKPNERLEFLGDAVLGAVTAEQLMTLFPQDHEGALSKKRASIINQDVLAQKAIEKKFEDQLIMGPGEKAQGSHLKPRILASTFEAIIGAIYLDSNFNQIQKWITKEFSQDIEKIKPDLEYEKDYKTRLQELTIKLKLGMPQYQVVSSIGPSHKPEFLVSMLINGNEKIRAQGKSKKNAEQNAAQLYLNELLNTANTEKKARKKA